MQREVLARSAAFLRGVHAYQASNYSRKKNIVPVVWQSGAARLLQYSHRGRPVLWIPSLINRAYVLDLNESASIVRDQAARGFAPYLLDWGDLSEVEKHFSCEDYILRILLPALKEIRARHRAKPVISGYCMGGVFAAALAQLAPQDIAGIALLATPWDFGHAQTGVIPLAQQSTALLETLLSGHDVISGEWIQSWFLLAHPWLWEAKFRKFASMPKNSPQYHEFIALEHWVNDAVTMSARVARECWVDWAQKNVLQRKQWRVGGQMIDPERLKMPVFAAVPTRDQIVPQPSAMALVSQLPHATVIEPNLGHVRMIVAPQAKTQLWNPLAEWMVKLS